MKGGKGFVLTELLVCLAAAGVICASAVAAYSSGVKLLVQRNEAVTAFNAASGAYADEELAAMNFTVMRQEVYCEGLVKPFYYLTVKNAAGKIVGSVVTGSE